ncbi:MAG: hypothetical protein H8D45_13580 [Bacteroidetes bacterium]|nr:hypothetical protein [Bacteroidota bacterium]
MLEINKTIFNEGWKACKKSKGKDIWDAESNYEKPSSIRSWNQGYNKCFSKNYAMDFVEDLHKKYPSVNNPLKQRRFSKELFQNSCEN